MFRVVLPSCLFLACVVSGGILEYAMRLPSAPKQLRVNKFTWEKCSESDNPLMDVQTIEMPDPILIPGNNNMRLVLNIQEDLDSQLYLKVRMSKKVFGILGIQIPCISNIGSCTYEDLCPLLNEFYETEGRCPANIPYDLIKCHCPLEKTEGYEDFSFPFNIDPSSISSLLAWLASGTYEVKVEGAMNGREVGCMQATLEIAQG